MFAIIANVYPFNANESEMRIGVKAIVGTAHDYRDAITHAHTIAATTYREFPAFPYVETMLDNETPRECSIRLGIILGPLFEMFGTPDLTYSAFINRMPNNTMPIPFEESFVAGEMQENADFVGPAITCYDCGLITADFISVEGWRGQSEDYCQENCADNFAWCDRCSQYVDGDNIVSVDCGWRDTEFMCENCADSNAYECYGCGGRIMGDAHYDCDCSNSYCQSCYDDRDCCNEYDDDDDDEYGDVSSSVILGYGAKKSGFITHGMQNAISYGIELETMGSTNAFEELHAETDRDFLWIKSDCSLDGQGAEIVTAPATMEFWQNANTRWLDNLRENGAYINSKCGGHIHIDRDKAFGKSGGHLAKFIIALQGSAENRHMFEFIAGRKANETNGYAEFRNLPMSSVIKSQITKHGIGGRDAINLASSIRETIEIRLFAGAIDRETILSRIEFLEAVIRYTKSVTPELRAFGGLEPRAIVEYINDNAETFPNVAKAFESYAYGVSNSELRSQRW